MEKFEQFFKENRLRLDTEYLDGTAWKNIETSFKHDTRRRIFRRVYAAASIVIILGLSFTLIFLNHEEKVPEEKSSIFSTISSDLAEQEITYIRIIDNQLDEIKKQEISIENIKLFDDFIQQLQLIDRQYELYKIEIEKHGYNNDLIQQIIYNYQLKLSVLQMLQSEIEKINSLTKQKKYENKKIKLDI